MKVLGNNVVCTPADAPTHSPGGLVLPPSVGQQYKCRAFVVSTGPEVDGLKAGDEIIFTTANKFTVNEQEYVVVDAKDILVVV